MPRFLRIKNTMIHVPSLFNVNMGTSWFGYPFLRLSFHTKQECKISYDKWETCERDLHRIMIAIKEIETALQSIPLLDEAVSVSLQNLTPVASTEKVNS